MAKTTYDIRSRLIEKEMHFRLLPDALVRTSESGEGRIAYDNVRQVNLTVGMSQYGMAANCTIRPKNGKRLVFGTVHFASITSCENRAAAYGPFVRELLARIADATPDAVFTRGRPLDLAMLRVAIGMLIVLAAVLLVVIGAFELSPQPVMLGLFAFVAVTIPATYGLMRKFKPKTIDPRDVPDDLVGPRAGPQGEGAAAPEPVENAPQGSV